MPKTLRPGPSYDLPASPFRKNAEYVGTRDLEVLKKLNTPADVIGAASRANEILDRNVSGWDNPGTISADGTLTLAELDRLSEPLNNQVLSPQERAALPSVHALFELPAPTALNLPGLTGFDFTVVGTGPVPLPLAGLTQEQRDAAIRVQRVRDADADPQTISASDVEWARNNTGPFTQATMDALNSIVFGAPRQVFAKLPPENQTRTVFQSGGVQIDLTANVQVVPRPFQSGAYEGVLEVVPRDAVLKMTVPPGYKVMVRELASNNIDQLVTNGQTISLQPAKDPWNSAVHVPVQLWVQVVDPAGALVANQRVSGDLTMAKVPRNPALKGWEVIDGWTTATGAVAPSPVGPDSYTRSDPDTLMFLRGKPPPIPVAQHPITTLAQAKAWLNDNHVMPKFLDAAAAKLLERSLAGDVPVSIGYTYDGSKPVTKMTITTSTRWGLGQIPISVP